MTTNPSRRRNYFWTLNNYTASEEQHIMSLDCKYMLFGREVGASGTPHLQGMTYLRDNKTLSAFKAWMGTTRLHVEPTMDIPAAIAYCKKGSGTPADPIEPDFFERGTPPMSQAEKGKAEQDRWETTLELAKRGKFDEIEAQLQITQCRNLEYIHNRVLRERVLEDTPHKMLWFHGKTGTGKSRKARHDFPNAYLKMCNKWWDGYKGEDCVIIEEISLQHAQLIHHIKIWLDRYPFPAETKGLVGKIRPKVIVVCSNYTPREIWPLPSDYEPVERRCTLWDFNLGVPFVNTNPVPVVQEEVDELDWVGAPLTPTPPPIDELSPESLGLMDLMDLCLEGSEGELQSEADKLPIVEEEEEEEIKEFPYDVVDVSQWI